MYPPSSLRAEDLLLPLVCSEKVQNMLPGCGVKNSPRAAVPESAITEHGSADKGDGTKADECDQTLPDRESTFVIIKKRIIGRFFLFPLLFLLIRLFIRLAHGKADGFPCLGLLRFSADTAPILFIFHFAVHHPSPNQTVDQS